jgi:hypothetical protein
LDGDFADIAAYPPANYKGYHRPSSWKSSRSHPTARGNIERLLISPP